MRKPNLTSRLDLETFEQRLVPATLIDLTHAGDQSNAGDAVVMQTDAQPTGTGYIRSFLRIQGPSNGSGDFEQGYNTDARPLQFDENKSPQFTRSLTANLVPTVVIGDVTYREF